MTKPRARTDGVLVEELADECVVYDLASHHVHALPRTAARVFRACNGRRDLSALAAAADCRVREAAAAVAALQRAGLLEDAPVSRTRRRVLTGAAAVVTMAAPTAAQAATCRRPNPVPPGQCGQPGTVGCCCTNGRACRPNGTCSGPC